MENVKQFVEQLLKEKDITNLEPAVHDQLVSDLSNRLIDFINRRLIDAMSEDDVKEFMTLLDQEPVDPTKVQAFMGAHVPDTQQVTMAAMMEFRALYVGKANEA